jgi:group I intron endonuclease
MSEDKSGENHPKGMLGKIHSSETKALMSEALSGEKNPRGMLGKFLSAETKTLMSKAKIDKNHPNFGKARSDDTKTKISASQGTAIFVYDSQGSLVNTFTSVRKAAEYFNSHHHTIMKYIRNDKLFKDKWIFVSIIN